MKETLRSKIYRMNMLIWIPFFLIILMAFYIILSTRLEMQVVENLKDKSYTYQLYAMKHVKPEEFNDKNDGTERTANHLADYIFKESGYRAQIYGILKDNKNTESELFLLADSGDEALPYTNDVTLASAKKSYTFLYKDSRKYLSFSSPIYSGASKAEAKIIGVIRFIYPLKGEYTFIFKVIGSIVGFALVIMLLNIFLTKLMAEKITFSINELRKSISSVQSGGPATIVDIKSGDEIEELGKAFNDMQNRINEYISNLDTQSKQMQIFFNGAAHQLKTPLTSIIGYSQIIQVSDDPDEICEDAFIIEEAGEKLLKSINTLIADSRQGVDMRPIQPVSVDFYVLAKECIQLLKPRLQKLHISCEVKEGKNAKITTDREILKEIILTVMDNAIIHSECSMILLGILEIDNENNRIKLEIADNGKGISNVDKELVFKVFYQNKDSFGKGTGLGLSVCATLAQKLGGDIYIADNSFNGCSFIIELPMEITL